MKKNKLQYILLPLLLVSGNTFKTNKGSDVITPFVPNNLLKLESSVNEIDGNSTKFNFEFISDQKFAIDPSDKYEKIGDRILSYKSNNIENRFVDMGKYPDTKEDNDSFQNATPIFKITDFQQDKVNVKRDNLATISQKKTSIFPWAKKYVDKDFYSFDVNSIGKFTVELGSIPENCNYDLRLWKLDNNIDTKLSSLDFYNPLAISEGQNTTEVISIDSTPGTYFICVYSYKDETFNNEDPYHISFTQKADTSRKDFIYNIEEGKKSGDIGAIWTSQYKPLGITPVTIRNSDARVKIDNFNENPFIRNIDEKYNSIDNYLNYAVLYIWDLKTKLIISEIAKELLSELKKNPNWVDNKQYVINITTSAVGFGLTAASTAVDALAVTISAKAVTEGILASIAPYLGPIGLVLDAASLGLAIYSLCMCFQTDTKFVASKAEFESFLTSMRDTFSVGEGSNDKEVKILRLRYHFDNEGNDHFLNFSPSVSANDYNFYNNKYIYSNDSDLPIGGTISGLKSTEEIEKILSK